MIRNSSTQHQNAVKNILLAEDCKPVEIHWRIVAIATYREKFLSKTRQLSRIGGKCSAMAIWNGTVGFGASWPGAQNCYLKSMVIEALIVEMDTTVKMDCRRSIPDFTRKFSVSVDSSNNRNLYTPTAFDVFPNN